MPETRTFFPLNVHFFLATPNAHFFLISFVSMSDISGFDDDLNQIGFDCPPSSRSNTVFGPGCEDVSQRKPRPLLRSRPDIDFSRYSTTGSDVGFHPTSHKTSRMSGSTLGSGLNSSATPLPSYKPHFSTDSLPALSSKVIALLSVAQLLHNPHYRLLQERYDSVCEILIERDLAESRSMRHDAVVPEMCQGM